MPLKRSDRGVGMTLRTPRRRISPRTKHRYRAIKGFLRRTLASATQSGFDITSSIALNVNKKIGPDQRLHEANKLSNEICDDIPEGEPLTAISSTVCNYNTKQDDEKSRTKLNRVDTRIKYKISDQHYKKVDDSESKRGTDERNNLVNKDMRLFYANDFPYSLQKKNNDCKIIDHVKPLQADSYFHNHKTNSVYDSVTSAVTSSSFHSLNEFNKLPRSYPGSTNYEEKINRNKNPRYHYNYNNEEYKEQYANGFFDEVVHQRKPNKKSYSKELDEDFIADIIQRQYKSVKTSRKISDLSQFSGPECRDKMPFDVDQDVQPHYKNHRHTQIYATEHNPTIYLNHHSDHNDINDEHYNYKKKYRIRQRRKHLTNYNDSNIYDVIPIKEKTSPKSRRKFFEDNMAYTTLYKERLCKEIPPSPKTHRPKFNLKVGHHEHFDDYDHFMKPKRRVSPKRTLQQHIDKYDYDMKHSSMRTALKHTEIYEKSDENHCINESRDENIHKIYQNMESYSTDINMKQDSDTIVNDDNVQTMEPSFVTQGILSADKTDKALCDIKDILQNFLQEIKKESPLSGQSGVKSNNEQDTHFKQFGELTNTNCLNNNSAHHPIHPSNPFMPQFVNAACCYPVLPICPMSCMQNVPSRSSSYTNCVNKHNESGRNENLSKSEEPNKTNHIETNEMIKEIHELITRSPTFRKKHSVDKLHRLKKDCIYSDTRLTEKGAGSARSAHNAKIGLPRTISKSCDAITPKLPEESTAETNASYSDNISENLSLKATATECTSGTKLSFESEIEKVKKNRFARILQSFRIFKKKKKDVIEELSESEGEEDTMRKSPFQQNITNYMMHDQDYFKPPPVFQNHRPDYKQNYRPHTTSYNPGVPEYQTPVSHSNKYRNPESPHPMGGPYHPYPGDYPSAPPLSNPYMNYSHMQPQVPLCLKEIEVKSIGCQSEKKFSFFRRIGIKKQKPVETARFADFQNTCSTQTAQNNKKKPGFFGWSNLESKSMNQKEPLSFTYKKQHNLAQGDTKLREVMLKKMLKKKNPFSLNNLLKTLLGNDKSSYVEPPTKYRPRIFL